MTPIDRTRLRELAAKLAALHAPRAPMNAAEWEEWAVAADEAADEWTGATQPSTVLALLDALEAVERERDEARERQRVAEVAHGAVLQTAVGIVAERDALAALLRDCREAFAQLPASLGYEYTHIRRIDAALDGAKGN